jgi:hypothetical protein
MRSKIKYLCLTLVCAIGIYVGMIILNTEGFQTCVKRKWWIFCASSMPDIGEKCSVSCNTGTCQEDKKCHGSAKVGEKCNGHYSCANLGPNGRETFCIDKVCSEANLPIERSVD